jgi:hypothetical protein
VSGLFAESYQCFETESRSHEFCQANAAGFADGASDDGRQETGSLA